MTARGCEMVTTIVYGYKTSWANREKAMDYFWNLAMDTAGSRECERYCDVYNQLVFGKDVASDGSDMIFFEDEELE